MEKNKVILKRSVFEYIIPMRTFQVQEWQPADDEVDLTVPNLEDNMEQFVARQRAGVDQFNSRMQRNYPTDPNSLRDAQKVIADIQQRAKDTIAAQEARIKEIEAQNKKIAAEAAKEQQAYEAWKSSLKDSGK
ncbi:MAG: hypothetical protein [Microviridae sp.]|nr:MAG: hypothetical protein [Microviridae sp.]